MQRLELQQQLEDMRERMAREKKTRQQDVAHEQWVTEQKRNLQAIKIEKVLNERLACDCCIRIHVTTLRDWSHGIFGHGSPERLARSRSVDGGVIGSEHQLSQTGRLTYETPSLSIERCRHYDSTNHDGRKPRFAAQKAS